MTGPTETEVKIRIIHAASAGDRLRSSGFSESVPRLFEANTIYDTEQGELRSRGMLLRLRQAGNRAVLTWKGPEIASAHKSRPELETSVGSYQQLHAILEAIGYHPTFTYQKYRTEFRQGEMAGVVTVDETPIGDFLEIEGEPDWIDKTAETLGFRPSDYVLQSYGKLYLAECESKGIVPGNMVFGEGHTPFADRPTA